MRKYIIVISSIIICMMCFSCEKEIGFNYVDIDPILVIEGALTQNGINVSLTMTTPMDEPMNRTHITDATVSVTDITTAQKYILYPDTEGIYTSDLQGIESHTYVLEVMRDGKKYTAECTMGYLAEITDMEFSWIKMPYDEVAALQVTFRDNPDFNEDYYWIRLYRNGEAYKWAEIQDAHAINGYVDKVFMTTRMDIEEEDEDDLLLNGDIITATVVPVSKEMHTYLEALSVGNSNGPEMFEGDFCLGYFLAAPISSSEITFYRP